MRLLLRSFVKCFAAVLFNGAALHVVVESLIILRVTKPFELQRVFSVEAHPRRVKEGHLVDFFAAWNGDQRESARRRAQRWNGNQ